MVPDSGHLQGTEEARYWHPLFSSLTADLRYYRVFSQEHHPDPSQKPEGKRGYQVPFYR